MKTLIISLAAILVVIACSLEISGPISEYFSKKDLKIITSTYNKEQEIRAVLYGNTVALTTFRDTKQKQKAGAVFKLYTYKEQTDPVSYDFNIKSTLLKTETVTLATTEKGDLHPIYNKVEELLSKNTSVENTRERIAFILNLSSGTTQK